MDGTEVGEVEPLHQEGLRCLLRSHDIARSEPQSSLEVLGDLQDQPLKGSLADEMLDRLLIPSDLAETHGARAEAMRPLDTT